MWFELGHRIVWYIHGYECFRGAFLVCYKGHQMMEAVGPGQIVCSDHLDYMVPQLKRPQFQILMLYIFHALCHFVTKKLHTHVR